MVASIFLISSMNVIGAGLLRGAMNTMTEYGFRRTPIITDAALARLGMASEIQKALQERDIFSVIYGGTYPNPTTNNAAVGLRMLKENDRDSVISLGGDSPCDCTKGIALVAANDSDASDYENVDHSAKL